jgi:hypothetical protein
VNKDFADFQKYFKHYQKQFGLTGYKVYFKHEPLAGSFAEVTLNQTDMVATVRLNSKLPSKDILFRNVRQSAKHEALHLMLSRLEARAVSRYISSDEICEAVEELVFKLEDLIVET